MLIDPPPQEAVQEIVVGPEPLAIDPIFRRLENYSFLREQGTGASWWEAFKFIPLDERGSVFASVGGEFRVKYERFDNEVWGNVEVEDHDYVWTRFIPFVDVRSDDGWRVFTRLLAAEESGDEAGLSPIDENRLDVLEAFGEFTFASGGGSTRLRVGRQLLSYGSGRLVSTRYGPNVLQTFDAVTARHDRDDWAFEVLAAEPVQPEPGSFDDDWEGGEALWGAYATRGLDRIGSELDLYYLGFDAEQAVYDQGAADETRHTFGARLSGAGGGWDWNVEGFGQIGTFGGGDIAAWSIGSDFGRALELFGAPARLGLKANAISGDDDPGDEDLQTFNPLFPNGKYFGELGLVGPFNLINVHPSLRTELAEDVGLELGANVYFRESTGDGIYNNGGILLRPSGGSGARYIGTQFDVAVGYRVNRHLDFLFSASALTAGEYIEQTGDSDTIRFATLEMRLLF